MPDNYEEPKEQPLTHRGLDINAAETSWQFKGNNYLFVIAINKYKYWQPLRCAVKDVQDFVKVVTERYQFEQAYIYTRFE